MARKIQTHSRTVQRECILVVSWRENGFHVIPVFTVIAISNQGLVYATDLCRTAYFVTIPLFCRT